MPVMISSTPNSRSFACTTAEVRASCIDSSGWACKSRRHAVMSAWYSAIRLMIGMGPSYAF